MDKRVKVVITIGILILVVIAFYIISYTITKTTGYTVTGKAVYSKDEKIQIGRCLADSDVILYCSNLAFSCSRQKKILGEAFDYLSYVDCNENFEDCEELSLPAWKINNKFYLGIKELNELAELVNCEVRK